MPCASVACVVGAMATVLTFPFLRTGRRVCGLAMVPVRQCRICDLVTLRYTASEIPVKPKIYRIASIGDGYLYAMAQPRARQLEADVSQLTELGVSKVVCLLESDESNQLGLQKEQAICKAQGLKFERFEIADFGVPTFTELSVLAPRLFSEISAGASVLVHCRGGVGRTGLLCSCILIASGISAKRAVAHASEMRGCRVPETSQQYEMVTRFEMFFKNS